MEEGGSSSSSLFFFLFLPLSPSSSSFFLLKNGGGAQGGLHGWTSGRGGLSPTRPTAGSVAARSRGSSANARVSWASTPVDELTGLPLIYCPSCGDVRLIALTAKHTKNRGKRFFKCPKNHEGVSWSCRTYFFQPEYVKYLKKHGFIDAVPDPPEVKYLNLGMEEARSFLLKVPLKLKNLFDYCGTWYTSGALELDQIAELSAGMEMPRSGAGLDARISFLSEDWLKSPLKEHVMAVSVGLLSTMNHSLAYNLIWRTLTDPACMSSNSIQEHLGHRLLSSIKYACKVDLRDSSIRPTRGYALLSSFQVGCLAPGSKDSWYLRQEVDLRVAFPLGVLNGAFNTGMATGIILPLGFKAKGLEPKDFGTAGSKNSENGASTSPELHGGGGVASEVFADLSFDLPLKPLRELGIHGHAFVSSGILAKLTEHSRGKFALTDFLQTFRSSAGFGVVLPTRLFLLEVNYCYIPKQFGHDGGKAGVQFNFSSP